MARVYGLDVADLRTGALRVRRAANLAANLPPGSAVWREAGGPLAWTDEMHLLAAVEYRVQVLAWMQTADAKHGRNKPKPMEPPKAVAKVRSDEAAIERRARRYMRRAGVSGGD